MWINCYYHEMRPVNIWKKLSIANLSFFLILFDFYSKYQKWNNWLFSDRKYLIAAYITIFDFFFFFLITDHFKGDISTKQENTLSLMRILSRLDSSLNKDELTHSATSGYSDTHRATFNLYDKTYIDFSPVHIIVRSYRKHIKDINPIKRNSWRIAKKRVATSCAIVFHKYVTENLAKNYFSKSNIDNLFHITSRGQKDIK